MRMLSMDTSSSSGLPLLVDVITFASFSSFLTVVRLNTYGYRPFARPSPHGTTSTRIRQLSSTSIHPHTNSRTTASMYCICSFQISRPARSACSALVAFVGSVSESVSVSVVIQSGVIGQ